MQTTPIAAIFMKHFSLAENNKLLQTRRTLDTDTQLEKKWNETDNETTNNRDRQVAKSNAGRFTTISGQPLATEFQHYFMFTCLTASS